MGEVVEGTARHATPTARHAAPGGGRELDVVEELRFFADASDADGVVVTMLSGRTFADAADELERLRSEVVGLHSLIAAWCDADDEHWPVDDVAELESCGCDASYCVAVRGLRGVVGR